MIAETRTAEDTAVGLRAGSLEMRLARDEADVDAVKALRYRVFYEEMAAIPDPVAAARHRDFDQFDGICDHLLVIDRAKGGGEVAVVGTYRLLRRSVAERLGRFYSADEYDISDVVAVDGEIVELGRSCVDADYRNRATIQMLLRGLGAYVQRYGIVVMFGCASFPGVEPRQQALQLSYLHHHRLAPAGLRPRALPDRYVDMDLMRPEAIDQRAAVAALPPLIKGYVRAGCFVGDGAVIDRQFHTIDVCIVLEVDRLAEKFRHRYQGGAGDSSGG